MNTNLNSEFGDWQAQNSVEDRMWVSNAVQTINADFQRSADTHMIRVVLSGFEDQPLYLKDESTHPSGSLKHRLARSLFLYGLCNGFIGQGTPIVEASSGSTAISEAYFAKLLNLPFYAVVPESTSTRKLEQIEFHGGRIVKVAAADIYVEAAKLANAKGGHYMDQFTYAERVTDWRGNNNIAESLFQQMEHEKHAIPDWIVVGAGTGGTSATIGRYMRYRPELVKQTRLCVVDPENSVFFEYFQNGDPTITSEKGSRIEGIGRPRVEPSFQRSVVDRLMRVPDNASIATIWWLEKTLGRRCGGSTGTNVYGALQLMKEMRKNNREGSVVSMICDSGERYAHTYFNRDWLAKRNIDIDLVYQQIEAEFA